MAHRRTPLERFLDQAGQDLADTLDDVAGGLLVATVATLAGVGVAKAAPIVVEKVKRALKPAPATESRRGKPAKARKRLPAPNSKPASPDSGPVSGEVIDLHPGGDGVYR